MLEYRAKHRETLYTNHTRPNQIIGADTKTPKNLGPVRKNMATYPPPPPPTPNPYLSETAISWRFQNSITYLPPTQPIFSENQQQLKKLPLCVGMTPPPPGQTPIYYYTPLPLNLANKQQASGKQASKQAGKQACNSGFHFGYCFAPLLKALL